MLLNVLIFLVIVDLIAILITHSRDYGKPEAKSLFCKMGFHGKTDDYYESDVRKCTCQKCGQTYSVFDDFTDAR